MLHRADPHGQGNNTSMCNPGKLGSIVMAATGGPRIGAKVPSIYGKRCLAAKTERGGCLEPAKGPPRSSKHKSVKCLKQLRFDHLNLDQII